MNSTSTTSFKAFAFGLITTAALAAGVVHAEVKRERAAAVIVLDTVYITGKRVAAAEVPADGQTTVKAQVQTLPTVYITGRRDTTVAGDVQVAAL